MFDENIRIYKATYSEEKIRGIQLFTREKSNLGRFMTERENGCHNNVESRFSKSPICQLLISKKSHVSTYFLLISSSGIVIYEFNENFAI